MNNEEFNKIEYFENLILMLRELDTKKNSSEAIRDVLNFIADNLETYTEDIKAINMLKDFIKEDE